jgi:alpha-1,2-mannosyltransferase
MEAGPVAGALEAGSPGSRERSELPAGQAQGAGVGAVPRNRHGQRRLLVIGIAVFAASAAGRMVIELISSGQHWSMLDLRVYRWGGLIVRHSGDLYGSQFPYHHLRFTYPPIAALMFAALAAFSMPVLGLIFTIASITSLTAVFWLTLGMLGYRRSAVRAAVTLFAAGVALWLGPVQQTLGLGQVNLMLMLVIIADFCLPGGSWAKGAGVGLAAGLKLTPLIFLPYLLLTRRFRAAGISAAVFALTIAASLLLLPSQSNQFWLAGLFLNSGRTGNVAYVGNQSLNGTLARLLGSVSAAQPYWLAAAVVVGALGLLLAARWARRGYEIVGILTCALTGLLISPVSWAHHWVWIAPAIVVAVELAVRSSPKAVIRDAGRAGRWLPWAYGSLAVALAMPFFAVPESLVPASIAQGHGAHGLQLLTGNVYVIVGLVLLCLLGLPVGSLSFRARSRAEGAGPYRPHAPPHRPERRLAAGDDEEQQQSRGRDERQRGAGAEPGRGIGPGENSGPGWHVDGLDEAVDADGQRHRLA